MTTLESALLLLAEAVVLIAFILMSRRSSR